MRRELEKSEPFTSGKPTSGASGKHFRRIALGVGLGAILISGALMLTTAAGPHTETVALPQSETTTCCSTPDASSAATQDSATTTSTVTQLTAPDPPGTIDGAKNPELIPDGVAMRMIVLAVAEPTGATEEQWERARAKLSPIGLSKDDSTAFLSLLGDYQTHVDALDGQVVQIYQRSPVPDPSSTDYKQLLELGTQKDQLTNNAVAAIPAKLSAEGLEKLRLAKKGMKIIPNSDTSLMPGN